MMILAEQHFGESLLKGDRAIPSISKQRGAGHLFVVHFTTKV